MLKIGCFAFGGGYAIIALLENEFISKRNWIDHDEFLDVVAIAESTPGPIAINVATYIGYKLKGFVGAVVATVGMCLPSFIIMYLVSLFYEQFMDITLVAAAFKGIQICVVYLIASAGLKMLKKMKKTPQNIIVFSVTCIGMILCTLFDIHISSVWFILAAGVLGLSYSSLRKHARKERKRNDLFAVVLYLSEGWRIRLWRRLRHAFSHR